MTDFDTDLLGRLMYERLTVNGVTDRPTAVALNTTARDAVLNVAAWSGIEDEAWGKALERLDPYPVGATVRITDHDGSVIDDLFTVVRSYWPVACCEVVGTRDCFNHLIRNNHDRLTPTEGT